jgi:hypothetical protein
MRGIELLLGAGLAEDHDPRRRKIQNDWGKNKLFAIPCAEYGLSRFSHTVD